MAKIKQKKDKSNLWAALVLFWVFLMVATPIYASTITSATVISLVNEARRQNNLPALTENAVLDRAAAAKAEDMLRNDYFAHTSPSGVDPWHWFDQAGYDYKYAGENLAINFTSAEKQQLAWMKSATHRKNILNQSYREIGVAVAEGRINGEATILTVQLFGTPAAVTAQQQPADAPESMPAPQEEQDTLPAKEAIMPQDLPVNLNPEAPQFASAPYFQNRLDYLGLIGQVVLVVMYLSILIGPAAVTMRLLKNVWQKADYMAVTETGLVKFDEHQLIISDFHEKLQQAGNRKA